MKIVWGLQQQQHLPVAPQAIIMDSVGFDQSGDLSHRMQADLMQGVPEKNLSSRVEESFDSGYRPVECDSIVPTYRDDLSEACRRGDKAGVVQLLICSNQTTEQQLRRVVEVSAAENKPDIITYVLNRAKNTSSNLKPSLFESAAFIATHRGHMDSLKCLMRLGVVRPGILVDSTTGNTLLHVAVAQNHVHIVDELYRKEKGLGTKCNAAGLVPLNVAVITGHQQVLESMLESLPCSPVFFKSNAGNTALHSACQNNQEAIAEFLITQSTPDFLTRANNKGFLPIHFAAAKGNLRLVQMLSEYMERRRVTCNSKGRSGWTPLHCAVETGHLEVVKHFCSQPNFKHEPCTKDTPITPLHSAALNGKQSILDYLLRSGKFAPGMMCPVFVCSNSLHLAAHRGHTSCCQLLVDDYNLSPLAETGTGYTSIHLAAGSGSLSTLKYLVEIKGHSPTVSKFNRVTPLHVAASYGHAEVVSWLLSTGKCEPNASIRMTKSTPLHLAASGNHLECVKALAAHKGCNPNAKAVLGMTPLASAASDEICWELIKRGATPSIQFKWLIELPRMGFSDKAKYGFLESWSAVLPSVRLFLLGASGAGKSTLAKSLQNEDRWIKGWFVPVKKDEVEPHTSGVVPLKLESSTLGRVTIYDFAGDEEYYSSHEAILDKAGHSLPIFLLVVNLENDEGELKRQFLYWKSFIKQCTHSSNLKPKIVVLGSHHDCLRRSEYSSKETALRNICESEAEIKWLTIDCRYPTSRSMTKLRNVLQELCVKAKSSLPVHYHAHAFAAFLKHTFTTACRRYEIDDAIDAHGPPVTEFKEEAEVLLQNLSNSGYIIYLLDKKTPGNGWVIIDQQAILQGIHGYQKRARTNNLDMAQGVISLQQLKQLFQIPGCNPYMVARYLVHMEFCHEINSREVLYALTKETRELDGRYFLFPDLIETEPPEAMWLEDQDMSLCSGFVFRCQSSESFITPRFVQVLLLRIAFNLAATTGIATSNNEAILPECSLWKNGIHWVKKGVETIVELTEGGRSLLVICRSGERNRMDLVRHRAAVAKKVGQVIKEFPGLSLDKLVLHPQNCQYRPNDFSDQQVKLYRFENVLNALTNAKKPEEQHVNRTNMQALRVAATQCHVDELLYFESLSLVNGKQLEVMSQWGGNVDEQWLYENLATYNMSKWKEAARILDLDEATIVQISDKQQGSTSCFRDALTEWLNRFECQPTFSDLVSVLEKYSIFQEEDMKQSSS